MPTAIETFRVVESTWAMFAQDTAEKKTSEFAGSNVIRHSNSDDKPDEPFRYRSSR